MKRKDFLRNAMMAIAVSLVPKILQPLLPEPIEEVVDIEMKTYVIGYDPYSQTYTTIENEPKIYTFKMSKKDAEFVAEYQHRIFNKQLT